MDNCIEGKIGKNTKVWRWSHIAKTGSVGDNCMIGQGCYIAGKVGNNCKIQNGVQIFEGVEIGDDCFIGPHVVFTNVKYPDTYINGIGERTVIKNNCSIGANATILCGITLEEGSMIGAGAIVTKDVRGFDPIIKGKW